MRTEDPVDLAVQTLTELREESHRNVPTTQLGIERVTSGLGKPWFAWTVLAFVILWIGGNTAFRTYTHRPFDSPQFPLLELIVSLGSLLIAILILITQNRQNDVAHRRAEITLQMALVTEQKVAKVIDLLEQLRRDDPHLPNREDAAAASMAQATDVREAAAELKKAQERGYE
ncbi:MAG: DUF1003 domain-containing protein [Candidatus Eremiobacteraeota bacterium]|nr:DUF1003 domain-containing protein [Candidatus Eremiobacteraeota bacterium]